MNRDTICVQGGYTPGNGEPRQIPIIQSTTFKYATSEDMGKLFDLEADGYFYSRLQNPTCDLVAKKICELEGGTAAMLTSSGQAANFFALFNLCQAGDHIVASSTIYGGTFNLISVTMKKMGIEATFVDPLCTEEELNAAFRPNTKAVFGETIANPALTVLDIEKFAQAAHAHGVPLIVDNTFPTAAGPARPRVRSGRSTPPCGLAAAPPALNKYGCTGSIPCLSSFVALLSSALTSFLPFTIMKSTGRCCRRLTVPPKFFHPIFDRFRAENASEVHPCIR